MYPWCLSFALAIACRHNKWLAAFNRELINSTYHPAHGVVRQRSDSFYAILFLYLSLCREYGRARKRPVYDLRCRPPRFVFATLHFCAICGCMCTFRPHNRPSIAPGYQHEPFSTRRRAIVCGNQNPKLNSISKVFQLAEPLLKSAASFFLHRLAFPYRPPCLKLLNILEDDNPRLDSSSPTENYPRKSADITVNERRALRLAKVLAIRRKPRQPNRTPRAYLFWVYIPNGSLQMLGIRMISLVHQDCGRIMVNGYCNRTACCEFYTSGSTTSPGKVVHYNFIKHGHLCSIHFDIGSSFIPARVRLALWCWDGSTRVKRK